MKKIYYLILITFCLSVLLSAESFAAKDPETAKRQAEIDADQREMEVENIEHKREAALGLDGIDSPEVVADDKRLNEIARQAEREREAKTD